MNNIPYLRVDDYDRAKWPMIIRPMQVRLIKFAQCKFANQFVNYELG